MTATYPRVAAFVAFVSVAAATAGCRPPVHNFVWVNDVASAASTSGAYRIRDIDTVSVRVYNQEALTTRERVRPDGRISIPFVGEIEARGKTPMELAKELEVKLKPVIVSPIVSVGVDQSAQISVSVVGEVRNAGTYNVDSGSGVLHAIASAGGLTDYASDDRIFVLRKGMPKRVRFRLDDVRGGNAKAAGFNLQNGDLVVVE